MKPEYYKPGEIRYSKEQVLWLLRNVLFQDSWPSDHMETGYSGGKGHTVGHQANFEMIRMIIGELNARLRQCGKAGLYLEYLTLIDYGDQDYLMDRLAGYHGIEPGEVSYLSRMAMLFCCGRKRKIVNFDEFCDPTESDIAYRECHKEIRLCYDFRKANGLCVRCGKPAVYGGLYCMVHQVER